MRIARGKLDESLASSFNSRAFRLDHLEGYSLCVSLTETSGPLAGNLKLQASNDAFLNDLGDGTLNERDLTQGENPNAKWADIVGSSYAVSGTSAFFWNVSDSYYAAFRLVYTRTSGDGTLVGYSHMQGGV